MSCKNWHRRRNGMTEKEFKKEYESHFEDMKCRLVYSDKSNNACITPFGKPERSSFTPEFNFSLLSDALKDIFGKDA